MPRPEDKIKDDFCRKARETYGEDIVIFKINDSCTAGLLDTFICFFGRFVVFEFKNGKTPPKPHEHLQNYNIVRIRRANGFGAVVRSSNDGLESLKKIREII